MATPHLDRVIVELRGLVAAGCPPAFAEDRLIGRSHEDARLFQRAGVEFAATIGRGVLRRETNGLRQYLRRAVEASP
jgi:hypothetical protein